MRLLFLAAAFAASGLAALAQPVGLRADAAAGAAVTVDPAALAAAAQRRTPVALHLADGTRATVRPVWTALRGPGRASFAGPLVGADGAPVGDALVTVEGAFVVARIVTAGGVTMVEPDAAGAHHARTVAPEPEAPGTDAVAVPETGPDLRGTPDDPLWPDAVEIAFLVTPATAAVLGAGLPAFEQAALDAFTLVLANAGAPMRVRYAATGVVDYEESGDFYTDYYNFSGTNTGAGHPLHAQAAALREATSADLVHLITTNAPQFCGVAALATTLTGSFAPRAYGVTRRTCAVGNLTFPHEAGHNLGLHHDRAVTTGQGVAPFAYGFVNLDSLAVPGAAHFRSVMAYVQTCTDAGVACPKVAFYSRPDTLYNGRRIGSADDDNARAVALSMPVSSRFRAQAPLATLAVTPDGASGWNPPACSDPADASTCGPGTSPPQAYTAAAFSVSSSGRYTARRMDASGSTLWLYRGAFDAAAPLAGLVAGAVEDAAAPAARRLLLERALAADTAYTLVVSMPPGSAAGAVEWFGPAAGSVLPPVAAGGRPAPSGLALALAGANPFSGATAARLVVPAGGPVRATLVDALGRTVGVVFDGEAAPGVPLALPVGGAALAPGVYTLRVAAGGTAAALRLVRTR